MSSSINNKYVVADFVCPYKDGRKIFKYDYLIWVDTIKKSRFKKKKLAAKIKKKKLAVTPLGLNGKEHNYAN